MSILIRGVEMPTRCWDCLLNTYGYCMASDEHSDIVSPDAPIPEWCPLVLVPPHGRLIDADALKLDLTRFYDGEVVAKRLIDEQPTIIPASEEGE